MPPATRKTNDAGVVEEDTIVVKGNDNYWGQQSSPESSPEVEPLVANLLPSINGPQSHLLHLESPEPEELEEEEGRKSSDSRIKAEQHFKHPSQNSAKPRQHPAGTSEERLLQLPELRPLPWRDGVDPASENLVGGDSRRKQIRFGCLLATRGEVQKVPCSTCANGRGKFKVCVALDDFFKGACASCQLSGGPNRCSIKKQDEEDGSPVPRSSHEKRQKSHSHTNKRPASREPPQQKRRKTTDAVVTDWEGERPQWRQEQVHSHTPQQMTQNPWAAINQSGHQTITPPTLPITTRVTNDHPPAQQYTPDRRVSGGWAAVNQLSQQHIPQPVLPPLSQPQAMTQPVPHPAPQPPGSVGNPVNGDGLPQSIEQLRREDTVGYDNSVALINTLPRGKQRQLYGLINGIQGGIKHLQTELDTLKKMFGIEDRYPNL